MFSADGEETLDTIMKTFGEWWLHNYTLCMIKILHPRRLIDLQSHWTQLADADPHVRETRVKE